jgi:CheY-like chemotaxis protein
MNASVAALPERPCQTRLRVAIVLRKQVKSGSLEREMAKVLIVEDQATDAHLAADVVRSLGISDSEIEARSTAGSAKVYLESALEKNEGPDLIVLDLDLGYDSGHEVLRYWHTHRGPHRPRMVVWTAMGNEQQEMCKLFNVDAVVSKHEGAEALAAAVRPLAAKAS